MRGKDKFENRKFTIQLLLLIGAITLLAKSFQIQLLDQTYKNRAAATTLEKRLIYPSRGLIFDRNGQLLVQNDALYDLMVTYNKVNKNMDTLKFCSLLNLSPEEFKKSIEKDWSTGRFSKNVPYPFAKKIPHEMFNRFQEFSFEFPGFEGVLRNARAYPHSYAANVLGYIKEVDQNEIDKSQGKYRSGDYTGATGLEKFYEDSLRGKMGIAYILRDNIGREVGSFKEGKLDSVPESGIDLISSLDLNLQKLAEELMINKKGAIVAIEPSTGEILAMISAPTYDPNSLSFKSDRGKGYGDLLRDTLRPLFDRSLLAEYPPGSIFKILVGLIGLEKEVWNIQKGVSCNAGSVIGGRWRGCHNHPYAKDLATAIEHSCNSYFFTLMNEIINKEGYTRPAKGLDAFKNSAASFGLGTRLGIDMPIENKGNIPSSNYYDQLYGKGNWRSPYIISIGIGQGEIQMTNLQIANFAAIIANRGHYIQPHLIKGKKDENGNYVPFLFEQREVEVQKNHFDEIIKGMERVVASGTARSAFLPDIALCGKTGTSENPHGADHSIFFGFAPKENPLIAVAVYVENSGYGGTYAAPIASLLIEQYLTGTIRESRIPVKERLVNANLLQVSKKPKKIRTTNASISDSSHEPQSDHRNE
jgi:penicillin-binding protein 2